MVRHCPPGRRGCSARYGSILVALAWTLAACGTSEPATAVVTVPVADDAIQQAAETATLPTSSPQPSAVPPTVAPTAAPPRVLVVCLAEEPESLYVFAEAGQPWRHVQEALRDGPIDQRSYEYQPVILEKLPHWEDGDVQLETTRVAPGEVVASTTGELVRLEGGVTYWTPDLTAAVAEADETITTIQMKVTFRLLPNVRWSDGEPLTAADSVFGFQILQSDDTRAPDKYVVRRTERYEAVDDLTARWTAVAGFLDPTYFLNFFEPLPAHAYGHMTAADLAVADLSNRAPLGWGAFRIAEWSAGQHIRLVPNEHYFRAAEGLPQLDEVVFVFAEAEDEALRRVLDGECDAAVRNEWGAWEPNGAAILDVMAAGQLGTHLLPGPLLEHLDFGIAPDESYFRPAGSGLFDSVDVRRALAYCLDRQALADAVQWGQGIVAQSYTPPNHPLSVAGDIRTYPFDPQQGRDILAEAGWVDTNGDGLRDQAGRSLVVRYAVNYPDDVVGAMRQQVAEFVQTGLREACGIGVEIEPLSVSEMYSEWPVSVVFGREFDLAQYAWLLPGAPRCDLYTTAEIPREGYVFGANAGGYSRADFDAACATALEGRARSAVAEAHQTAQRIFADDLPSLPLFFRLRLGVARPELDGFVLDPTQPSPLWNIEAFSLRNE